MTETTLRHIKSGVYGVGQLTYASFESSAAGATLTSRLYGANGAFISVRATLSMSPVYSVAQIVGIQSDPLGSVANGSWTWRDTSSAGKLYVWDVDGAGLLNYPAPTGWSVSQPSYMNGYLYWWEFQSALPRAWRLVKAACDLTGAAVVATINPSSTAQLLIGSYPCMALSRLAASTRIPTLLGSPVLMAARQPIDGSSGTFTTTPSYGSQIDNWLLLPAELGNGCVGLGRDGNGTAGFLYKPDDANTAAVLRWPQSGAWSLSDRYGQCWVSPDGSTALMTGSDDGVTGKVVGAATSATGGSPDTVINPALVDTDLNFGFMPMTA